MQKFAAPYRIQAAFDRLKNRKELAGCSIDFQELDSASNAGRTFPDIDFDTARVFVVKGEYSINVTGRIDRGIFHYYAHAYQKDGPWDPQYSATIDRLDDVVDFIVDRFKKV